jgi:release factor glutamine methyltransferase
MDSFLKYFVRWFVKPIVEIYLKKDRKFNYQGLKLIIFKGVFHPRFFFSTKYLASFVEKLNLTGKQFCEPCVGSGLISLVAAKNGAMVTSFDINPVAVKNTKLNFERNKLVLASSDFNVVESDLFSSIPPAIFDYIVINPPYFFNDVKNSAQLPWNAGKDGQFFMKFFQQLKDYTNNNSEIYMILADNCEIDRIIQIAKDYNWNFSLVEKKKILWEVNYIFRIQVL